MGVCLCSYQGSSFEPLSVFLSVILTDFGLETQVVPLHVSFDQVSDRPNYTRQQADVDSVLGGARDIQGKILIQLSQVCHFVVDARRLCNYSADLLLSAVLSHFWNVDLGGFVLPVARSS